VRFFKVILILLSINSLANDSIRVDLNSRWKILEDTASDFRNLNSRHLPLKRSDYGILEIQAQKPFSVFINSQLIDHDLNAVKWNLDSLKASYVFPITISIFSTQGLQYLSANLVIPNTDKENDRIGQNLTSKITLVSFLLIWVLILLFYNNGAATLEYFNFIKVFSIRNIDDGILSQRVTSFNNIFMYAFCSALVAVNLTLFSPRLGVNYSNSAGFTLMNVFILTGGILIILLIKIFLISLVAKIFGLSEFAPGQFFNFIKLLLGCFAISSVCQILIFIAGGDRIYWGNATTIFFLLMLGLYILTTFLRLINRGGRTVFHLFSYLCISEIFPGLLLLKIYNI
jgi:hypothetical protein